MKKYKCLFCDLDGTLIETITGATFPKGIWDMKLRLDVLGQIKRMKPEEIFIVTNQGGIEKGFLSQESFMIKSNYIVTSIQQYTGINCGISVCTTNNKADKMRKPNIGMLEEMLQHYHWEDCLMIGDASGKEGQFSDSDKQTAINAGIDYMDVNDFVYESFKD